MVSFLFDGCVSMCRQGLQKLIPELKASVSKGVAFANK